MKKLRFMIADKGFRVRELPNTRSRRLLGLGEPCPCACTLKIKAWGWEGDRFVVHAG